MPHPAHPRPTLRRLIAAALLAFLAALGGPAVAAATPTPAVQVHLLWGSADTAQMDRQLDRAAEAGVGMIRADFGWASLEQDGKGAYNRWYLGKADTLVAKAAARGIKVLFTVTHTPCWASTAPDTMKQGCTGTWWKRGPIERYAPANPADYADAMAFLVKHFGPKVAAWELWNEPNAKEFFNTPTPASDYAALVVKAYDAVKAVDPSAQVIAGSLQECDWEFTEKLYDNGIKGHFDGFSFHPYSGDRSPVEATAPHEREHSFSAGVPAIRDVLAAHGDARPLWLTEFGWSTADLRGGRTWENGVDEATQARFLEDAYARMASWDDVAVGTWFNLTDTTNGSSELVNHFGLLRLDGTPKPAFAAYARAAAALRAAGGAAPVNAPPALTGFSASRPAGGPVTIRTTVSTPGTVTVKGYKLAASGKRFEASASYRVTFTAQRAGTATRKLLAQRLRKGTWRLVARAHGSARALILRPGASAARSRRGARRASA